jgi:hypothetical protein
MDRTLKNLSKQQQDFINSVYIQLNTYEKAAELLNVDRKTISELNSSLEPIWRPITKARDKWKLKEIGGNFWDFYHWYLTADKCCYYCGVTEEELNELHKRGIKNKRSTRGKTLEIDRKIPDEPYSNIANLTYSCYWCNNAKTDTFSEEEFKIIGNAIGIVWKQRLGK